MARVSAEYPREFCRLYETALNQSITIQLPDENSAIAMQHQLHSYRRQLVSENNPLGARFRPVTVKRKSSSLTLVNQDQVLRQALAGLELSSPEPSEEELDRYLAQMGEESEEKGD